MTRHAIVIVGLLACGACGGGSATPTAPGGAINDPAVPPPPVFVGPIAAGETKEDALTAHGTSKAFRFTAPSNGTLVVQVSYDRAQGLVELNLEGQQISSGPPTIGRLPVAAGRTYTITIADGAPWDYDTLYLRFAVTVSME